MLYFQVKGQVRWKLTYIPFCKILIFYHLTQSEWAPPWKVFTVSNVAFSLPNYAFQNTKLNTPFSRLFKLTKNSLWTWIHPLCTVMLLLEHSSPFCRLTPICLLSLRLLWKAFPTIVLCSPFLCIPIVLNPDNRRASYIQRAVNSEQHGPDTSFMGCTVKQGRKASSKWKELTRY